MTVMSSTKQRPSIAFHPSSVCLPKCGSHLFSLFISQMDTLHLFLFVQLHRHPLSPFLSKIPLSLSFPILYFDTLFKGSHFFLIDESPIQLCIHTKADFFLLSLPLYVKPLSKSSNFLPFTHKTLLPPSFLSDPFFLHLNHQHLHGPLHLSLFQMAGGGAARLIEVARCSFSAFSEII